MNNEKAIDGTRWLTKKDLMRYLSISKRTVENYMSDGIIRFYKISGRVLFDQAEIDQDVRKRRV